MSDNLLKNPGFEADWSDESSQWAQVFPVDAPPYHTSLNEIHTPPNWMSWFYHDPGTFDQPEIRDAWAANDPRRVHGGNKAQIVFTFFRGHDAGFYQMVEVEPGVRLQASAWAHAWSNHGLEGHEDCLDDPYCSCGVGRELFNKSVSEAGEPDGKNSWTDAVSNFTFRVGIDPTGGTDPFADTVVWGEGRHIYNAHAEVRSNSVVSVAGAVTVFLRSTTRWPFKHNDAYWDDAELVVVGGSPQPPIEKPRGYPREQYDRIVNVIKPTVTESQAVDVFREAWGRGYETVTGSYDDAGIGDLDIRKANLYGIDEASRPQFEAFYETYYPGVEVKFLPMPGEPSDGILLPQRHPRWADEVIAGSQCNLTIGQTGCWITDSAMAQRCFGIDADATPSTVNQTLGVDGFSGCKTLWSAMERLGLRVVKSTTDSVEACDWVRGINHCAFAEVVPGDAQHFVLVCGDSDSYVMCYDPWRNVYDDMYTLYPAGAESWRLIEKIDNVPPDPPLPPSPTYPYNPAPIISLHVQGNYSDNGYGIMEWLRDVKPAAIKFVDEVERARDAKTASPNTITVGRFFRANQNRYWKDVEPEIGAVNFLDEITDTLRNVPELDYIESLNEVIECGNPWQNDRVARFDATLAYKMQERGLSQKLVAQSAGVGNPFRQEDGVRYSEYDDKTDLEIMLPAVEAVCDTGGALGPHIYNPVIDSVTDWNIAWPYYAGRPLDSWDKVFTKYGYYPRYIFGEAGAIRSDSHYSLKPNDGWKMCYNLERMQDDLDVLSHRIRVWNNVHGNRVIAALLFTFAGYGVWANFEYSGVYKRMRWGNW